MRLLGTVAVLLVCAATTGAQLLPTDPHGPLNPDFKLPSRRWDGYNFTIAVLAIFRWEGPYLREWMEYHMLLGVEHFYLLSNDCDKVEYSTAILQPYVDAGVVTLDTRYLCKAKFQRVGYNKLFQELKAAKLAEWCV